MAWWTRTWYTPNMGEEIKGSDRYQIGHRGDLYLVWRQTNPGGWAQLNLTARRQGVVVHRDSFNSWPFLASDTVSQFAPHTVDRGDFPAADTALADPWGTKPWADPIGPYTRILCVRWPDNVYDWFSVYPLSLPVHDSLELNCQYQITPDDGPRRLVLAVWIEGHQYQF